MISISTRFLSDAALAMAIILQDLFFKFCDFVSKLGEMSTKETETIAEQKRPLFTAWKEAVYITKTAKTNHERGIRRLIGMLLVMAE